MAYEDFTDIPEKINADELRAELAAIGVRKACVCAAVTWTRVAPDGTETTDVEDAKVQVILPEGVSREDVQEVLASHNPVKSTDEVRQESIQKRNEETLKSQPLFQQLSSDLSSLIERFDELEKEVNGLKGK